MKKRVAGLFAALLLMNFSGIAYSINDLMKDSTIPEIFESETINQEIGKPKEPPGVTFIG